MIRFIRQVFFYCLVLCLLSLAGTQAAAGEISDATWECLDCHAVVHPGIVQGWRLSRHAATSPSEAMQVQGLGRKISSTDVPGELSETVVGCAECHVLRPDKHADTFEHNGYLVHTAVSPDDCGVCHDTERDQYRQNIMSHARGNLLDNAVYQDLMTSINGTPVRRGQELGIEPSGPETEAESCLYCHGTRLEVAGTELRETVMGEMEFPVIAGWPNQGSGRINLDGSKGSCAVCHTRHQFSMAEARKPDTCAECHIGPDVPAVKVYKASKHGTIYASHNDSWDFSPTPWTVGQDFTAPTCAVCHISLITDTEGEVVAERTHALSPRLPWRIFGLIYAHPQPASPDVTSIVNKDGLPLPTALDGTPASDFLIGKKEMDKRKTAMQGPCLACHDQGLVREHWTRFENTIERTNRATLTATELMQEIWTKGYATGPASGASLFDEYVEKVWSDSWLIQANHIRLASAIAGGGDYGVFAEGRYELNGKIRELHDWLRLRDGLQADR